MSDLRISKILTESESLRVFVCYDPAESYIEFDTFIEHEEYRFINIVNII
jgi:hypothetical protein